MERKTGHTSAARAAADDRGRGPDGEPAARDQLIAEPGLRPEHTARTWTGLADRVISLARDQRQIRVTLPGGGRLSIDHGLPYLFLYRRRGPPRRGDRLITGQASYLIACRHDLESPELPALLAAVAEALAEALGDFLPIEVWEHDHGADGALAFSVITPDLDGAARAAGQEALAAIAIDGFETRVRLHRHGDGPPLPAPALLDPDRRLGIAVQPIYRDPDGAYYPLLLLELERQLTPALQRAMAPWVRAHTRLHEVPTIRLAKSRVDHATVEVDRHLSRASHNFEFLLNVTPMNTGAAWHEFERSGFERSPELHYRPLPFDPEVSKRTLYGMPMEKVEDPVLATLFRDKHEELDRQISMLLERGTRAFLHSGVRIYGEVDDDLVRTANRLLYRLAARSRRSPGASVEGPALAEQVRAEIAVYHGRYPEFEAEVQVTDEIASGILVSNNRVFVKSDAEVPESRVDALMHHEVGTHLVTWVNGHTQPLQLLCTGLAGYETLQEGMAVLAEYLTGGLTSDRMRTLAGRVLACRSLTDGATFVDTYRLLADDCGFDPVAAYYMTVRAHRGGGLVKDAVYLRGLMRLLEHLGSGGKAEPLYAGKVSLERLDEIAHLQASGILRPPLVAPRFLDLPAARLRLRDLRAGVDVLDLVA
jgi:uncharacterized protein (TIGR02421 family)